MAFKYVILAACLAVAQAGYLAAPAAIGASQQSTLRSLDGNQVVSTYSKQVDTPYSSVRKYDSRTTNDAVYAAPAYAAYAAPAYAHQAYAAPIAKVAAPLAYAAPAYAHAAPAVATYAAAPAYGHAAYASPIAKVAAPLAYAAPVAHAAYAAPIAHHGAIGVAYSAAPAVAHISYDGAYSHYAY